MVSVSENETKSIPIDDDACWKEIDAEYFKIHSKFPTDDIVEGGKSETQVHGVTKQIRRMSIDLKKLKPPRRCTVDTHTDELSSTRRLMTHHLKVKKCGDNSDDQNDVEMTAEQLQAKRQHDIMQEVGTAAWRQILSKRAKLNPPVETKEEMLAKLTQLVLYFNYGCLVECANDLSLDSEDFKEMRNLLVNPLLSRFHGTSDANVIQDFSTVAGIPIFLLPSNAHVQTAMLINEYSEEIRTTSSGKVFRLKLLTEDEINKYFVLGSNFPPLPEISAITKSNLKALDERINPATWRLQKFGQWTRNDLSFATFKSDDPLQAIAIRECNKRLGERSSRHERGPESLSIMTALEKLEEIIIHPFDAAIAHYLLDTGLVYSEVGSGIIKMSNCAAYPSEEAMRNVFYRLPKRPLSVRRR